MSTDRELLQLALDALNSGDVLQRTRAVVELEKAISAPPQAGHPTVTVSRALALKTWGFLAQDCSPCAHPECQIDGKNIGVEDLHADWNAAILAPPPKRQGGPA